MKRAKAKARKARKAKAKERRARKKREKEKAKIKSRVEKVNCIHGVNHGGTTITKGTPGKVAGKHRIPTDNHHMEATHHSVNAAAN